MCGTAPLPDAVEKTLRHAESQGIDLKRWFKGDSACEEGMCEADQFERRLTGLSLGLSEATDQVLSREAIVEATKTLSTTIDSKRFVDLRKLDKGGRVWRPEELAEELKNEFVRVVEARHDGPKLISFVLATLRRDHGDELVSSTSLDSALRKNGIGLKSAASLVKTIKTLEEVEGENSSSSKVLFGAVRKYFWRIRSRLIKERNAKKRVSSLRSEKSADKKRDETEFRRALAGLPHNLDEFKLDSMLGKYEVLDQTDLDRAVELLSRKYVDAPDGQFDVLRLVSSGVKKSQALRDVKTRKCRELLESESSEAGVTRCLWKDYSSSKERRPFKEWLEESYERWRRQKEKVDEWKESKRELARKLSRENREAAPAVVVERELRDMVEMIDHRVDSQHVEPSRKGLDLEKKLRKMKQNRVVTRADFHKNFDAVAFSLRADPKVSQKARDLLDARSKLFRGSLQDAEKEAESMRTAKKNQNDADFRKWKARKSKAAASARQKQLQDLQSLRTRRDAARRAAKAALITWRKAQKATTTAKAASAASASKRHKKHLAAKKACSEFRDLDRRLHQLLKEVGGDPIQASENAIVRKRQQRRGAPRTVAAV